jgi:hypothetical protein
MDPFESKTHSFVVKIWLEDGEEESRSTAWRGHITHVPSKRRQYFESLSGIAKFVSGYLEKMGVEVGERWTA